MIEEPLNKLFTTNLQADEKTLLQSAGYQLADRAFEEIKRQKNPTVWFHRSTMGLEAQWCDGVQWTKIWYDFTSGEYQHLLKTFGKQDLLSRAVGASDKVQGNVLDATFGTGRDSLCLVKIGCHVVSYERQVENYLLAQDALSRASTALANLKGTLELRLGHASTCDVPMSCAYYDPMYRVQKKGKSRKEMEFLHACGAADSDDSEVAAELLQFHQRLVVKRPPQAPALLDRLPTHVFESKGVRFDMYVERRS